LELPASQPRKKNSTIGQYIGRGEKQQFFNVIFGFLPKAVTFARFSKTPKKQLQ
jgi:hypothetical protein